MNDFVTLYQPPEQTGEALLVEVSDARRSALLFCPAGVEKFSPKGSLHFKTFQEFKKWWIGAQSWLKKAGGFMIDFDEHAYTLQSFPKGAYRPPQRLWTARSGDPDSSARAIQAHTRRPRQTSERLIVPVSQTAEGELECWMEQLKGFPQDLRATVFRSLFRPGLEFRLRRLERAQQEASPFNAPDEQSVAKRLVTFFGRPTNWALLTSACSAVVSLALLVVVLTAGSGYSRETLDGPSSEPSKQAGGSVGSQMPEKPSPAEVNGSPAATTPREDSDGDAAPARLEESLEAPLEALLEELSRAEQDSKLGRLYASHFGKKPSTDPQRKVLDPKGWAIAKLHALLGGCELSDASLNSASNRSTFKQEVMDCPLPPRLEDSFVYFNCLYFGIPGLPQVPPNIEEYTIPKAIYAFQGRRVNCQSFDPEAVLKTIDELTRFAKNPALEEAGR